MGTVRGAHFKLVTVGETLLLLCDDIRPFLSSRIEVTDEKILGSKMRPAFDKIRRAAAHRCVHLRGETGSGKEIAARVFREYGPNARGPYVPVNCATIPEGLAESLLFGARKGSYSGAIGSLGYIQEANGGTLFLDEIGELNLATQAKLLRVLESGEVFALGASKPQKVNLCICSATHCDLREAVSRGSFREDLYYRVARPQVSLLPLRERREEIPFFIDRALRRAFPDLRPHVSLVEACLLRDWPGNVRELLVEIRSAGIAARESEESEVRASDLSFEAGMVFTKSALTSGATDASAIQCRSFVLGSSFRPSDQIIEAALKNYGGKVAPAARSLGLHRNQLRRWLSKREMSHRKSHEQS